MEKKQNLSSLLRQLESELRKADPKDPATRALIERLATDIRPLLNSSAARPGQHIGLRERLAEAATAFEAEHPRLATTVENVVNQLAQLNL